MPTTKVRTKLYFFSCNGAATAFPSLEKATVAAEEYSIDRGYPCEVFLCEGCKHPLDGHSKRVSISFHIRQSQVPREIPEEERWSPARHRALRARIKEENAARHAEKERVREEKLAVVRAAKEAEAAARRAAKEVVSASEAPAPRAERVAVEKPYRKVRAPKSSNKALKKALKKALRDQRRAEGLCPLCGGTPNTGSKLCEVCRVRCKDYARGSRQRRKNAEVRTAEEVHALRSKAVKESWVRRKAARVAAQEQASASA